MDKYDKLKELKTLLDKGLLNENEFSKLKNEILFENKNNIEESFKDKKIYDRAKENNAFSHADDISLNKYSKIKLIDKLDKESNNKLNKQKSVKYNDYSNNDNSLKNIFIIVGVIMAFFIWTINKDKSSLDQNNISTPTIDTTSTQINNSQENYMTTCKICGRSFSGDGYDKIDGVWQRNTNMQTELCSSNCAMIEGQRQDQKYNDILVKHGYAPIDFDAQSSTSNHAQPNRNGFFTGSDGQLHQASPCGYCHHTGFIDSGDGMQVCPMCDGKGEKIY